MHTLIFIPKTLYKEDPGYLSGNFIYDKANEIQKFYIIGTVQENVSRTNRTGNNVIGFYSGCERKIDFSNVQLSNWLNLKLENPNTPLYTLQNVFVDNQKVPTDFAKVILIIYDQNSMKKAELSRGSVSGEHFSKLKEILELEDSRYGSTTKSKLKTFYESLFVYSLFAILYPVLACCKAMNFLGRVSKYSTLGTHLTNWFENLKWMSSTTIESKKISLKTGNLLLAIVVDVILGVYVLRLILSNIKDKPPSILLLENAEKVVNTLQKLINWLMGSPAGLKLNHSFNSMLGKFFLYHIHLWWTFLKVIKPIMEFAFGILLLIGNLGVTFQISIIADLLALISFHTYCIYVYAARLFNIQLRGLIALFRLFLGKKKNPLRERVDSCQYQPNQLFIGTLFFTILLFLMPTTWVYYTVFTTLRLIMIGLSGFLRRLRFYIQAIPVYAFFHWLLGSHCVEGAYYIDICPGNMDGPVILSAQMVTLPWSETWKRCIPDPINICPPVKWSTIIKNIYRGELLYPL